MVVSGLGKFAEAKSRLTSLWAPCTHVRLEKRLSLPLRSVRSAGTSRKLLESRQCVSSGQQLVLHIPLTVNSSGGGVPPVE